MAWRSVGGTGALPGLRRSVAVADGAPAVRPVDRAVGDLAERNAVAVRHVIDGRLQVAATELEPLVADCRRRLGPEHPETLVVEGNLAAALVMVGQEQAGARLMAANLARRERVFGDEHPATLTARDAMAGAYRLVGRVHDALVLYSRVAPQRHLALGAAHPHTLVTRLGLGLALAETGETAMALDVVAAAVDDGERAVVEGWDAGLLRPCLDGLHRAMALLTAEPAPPAAPPARGPGGADGRTVIMPAQRAAPEPEDRFATATHRA